MHIALFGGRFDPPHNGHLSVAKAVLAFDRTIDEIWLLPIPHHHWKPAVASPVDRLTMIQYMEEKHIKASDFDMRHDNTYAIDTVSQLQESTNDRYLWICGADIINEFPRWKDYKELQKRVKFLIIPRNPYDILDVPDNFTVMRTENYVPTTYSSTEIRDRIKGGLPIGDMVPKKVHDYIFEKKLYK